MSNSSFESLAENLINIKCGEIYYTNQQFKFRCLLCECDLDIDSDSSSCFNFIKHYDTHFEEERLKETNEDEVESEAFNFKQEYIFEVESVESVPLTKISECIEEEEFLQEDEISKPEFMPQSIEVNTVTNLKKGITQITLPFIPKSSDNKYHCSYNDCGKSVASEELIQNHIRNIHILDLQIENEKFQCPVCDSSFTRKHAATNHLLKNHEILTSVQIERSPIDSKYHCPICKLSWRKLFNINRHLKYQHETFYNKLLEKQQRNLSKREIVIEDDLINIKIEGDDTKQENTQYLSGNRNQKILCEICGKELLTSSAARQHRISHSGRKPYKCDFCGKAFACSSNCKTHMRTHTKERNYACSYCDKRYNTSTDKKMHELVQHIKEKRFECEVCNRKFFKQFDLTRHTRRHTGNRPYECEICTKAFYEGQHLKEHMLSHTKMKKFQCDICQASFGRRMSLRAHKETHSSIKKYNCQICGQKFTQNAGLYSHKKTHHKELFDNKTE